ncbi:MAG: magnesium-translocating P-type ATPase [Olsenella sp.]|jgi:Mg2+-importing ATPase|nr:magnesium-translocating P-type ATPase [Olsenella sp.]
MFRHNGPAAGRGSEAARRARALDWLRQVSAMPAEDVLRQLGTPEGGLDPRQVELSRVTYGSNEVARARRKPAIVRLAQSFVDPFNGILALIAVVSLFTDVIWAQPGKRDPWTVVIILAMVVLSSLLRFVQEGRSGDAAQALAKTIQTTCNVERADEGRVEIGVNQVVVGDILHLGAGDMVPADARVTSCRDLFVGMSSLTGESVPLERTAQAVPVAGTDSRAAGELPNVLLMGSTVVSGQATAVVVATGANTMFGAISGQLGQSRHKTSYDEGIRSVSTLLLRLMVVMAPLVFAINGVTKGDWLEAALFSLSVAVGLTPEMLPMIVTTCLAKGAVDLSHDEVIVKRLDAIQSLGAMDVLCTDKTGTLTEDRVMLERHLDVMGNVDPNVLRYGFMNSFYQTGVRNLMDSAIIRRSSDLCGTDVGFDVDAVASEWTLVDEIPFDFERRRASVVVGDRSGHTLMVTKGALEEVLQACTRVRYDGHVAPLTSERSAEVVARAAGLADRGLRVLGVAIAQDPAGVHDLSSADEKNMTFVGYLAFLDPPKQSAAAAVAALREHGVQTKVLTGDSLRVACNVCRVIGIDVTGTLEGSQVELMDDAQLEASVERTTVFAKLTPDQKVRVVRALRARGHVVGFMGDGVNDAGAMRASDCGVSVDTAADVSKEAADIILLKKDLGVLERGVVTGRRTYANMNKYVKMTASSNFGNIFSVLVASAFLPFLPATAVQLLLLNFIYDVACTAIPWDRVDEEDLTRPRTWAPGEISSFMRWIGPTSSVFDVLTFALLFLVVCPAAVGGSWSSLAGDPARQALFAATFQSCWFVESMATQVLFVHLVRTRKVPFLQSMADPRVCALDVVAVALAIAIPNSPLAEALGMAALPVAYYGWLALVVAGYAALVLVVRHLYVSRFGRLL